MQKISIKFFEDREVRAFWDDENQLVSIATQLKIIAPDGKNRLTDMLDYSVLFYYEKLFLEQKQTDLLIGLP